jgi:hypothetical protein
MAGFRSGSRSGSRSGIGRAGGRAAQLRLPSQPPPASRVECRHEADGTGRSPPGTGSRASPLAFRSPWHRIGRVGVTIRLDQAPGAVLTGIIAPDLRHLGGTHLQQPQSIISDPASCATVASSTVAGDQELGMTQAADRPCGTMSNSRRPCRRQHEEGRESPLLVPPTGRARMNQLAHRSARWSGWSICHPCGARGKWISPSGEPALGINARPMSLRCGDSLRSVGVRESHIQGGASGGQAVESHGSPI